MSLKEELTKRKPYVIKQTKIISLAIILTSLVICMLDVLRQTATQKSFSKAHPPDFQAYYSIGYVIKKFGIKGLYDFGNQKEGQKEAICKNGLLKPGESFNGLLSIRVPPATAMILAPLAKLPYNLAYTIVLAINLLLLGGLAVFIDHHRIFVATELENKLEAGSETEPKKDRIANLGKLCLLFLIFPPLFENLNGGQISFLILWIITVSFWLNKKGKNLESGLVLSLVAIKPNFLILPFLVCVANLGEFLANRKQGVKSKIPSKFPGFLTGVIVGLAVFLLLNRLLYGKGFFPTYAKFLLESESYEYGTKKELNFNISSILAKFVSSQAKVNKLNLFINTFLLGIISLDFLLSPLLGSWESSQKSQDKKFMLATLFTPILNLHTMPVDMSTIILPVLFFGTYFLTEAKNGGNKGENKKRAIIIKIFTYVAILSPWLMYCNLIFVATGIYFILGFVVYREYKNFSCHKISNN